MGNTAKFEADKSNEVITLKHAFRILSKSKIIKLARINKYALTLNLSYKEICNRILEDYNKGNLNREFYNSIKREAFNPDLDVKDGFFLRIGEIYDVNFKELKEYLNSYNMNLESIYEDEEKLKFKFIDICEEYIKFLASIDKVKYIYNYNNDSSVIYLLPRRAIVEIYNNNIIYIQTKNSGIYSDIKGITQHLLQQYFQDASIKLVKPKIEQNLTSDIGTNGKIVSYHGINSYTIKFLDIIYELEDKKYNFSEFCVNTITFDHEDGKQVDLDTMIYSTSFDGKNLLEHNEVLDKILGGRAILSVNLEMYYNEEIEDNKVLMHRIDAGIVNEKGYFRIYIKDNDKVAENIMDEAYKKLKQLFINSFSSKKLKNEDKIKLLLRSN